MDDYYQIFVNEEEALEKAAFLSAELDGDYKVFKVTNPEGKVTGYKVLPIDVGEQKSVNVVVQSKQSDNISLDLETQGSFPSIHDAVEAIDAFNPTPRDPEKPRLHECSAGEVVRFQAVVHKPGKKQFRVSEASPTIMNGKGSLYFPIEYCNFERIAYYKKNAIQAWVYLPKWYAKQRGILSKCEVA